MKRVNNLLSNLITAVAGLIFLILAGVCLITEIIIAFPVVGLVYLVIVALAIFLILYFIC